MGFGHIVRKTVWYGMLGTFLGTGTMVLMQVAATVTLNPTYNLIGTALFGVMTVIGFAYGAGDAADEEEASGNLDKRAKTGNGKTN